MKSVRIHRYGGPDALQIDDVPDPVPGPRDVLVEVHAAGLNPIDFKIRQGKLRMVQKLTFPVAMGSELSGVVRETGAEVTRFRPGDRVFTRVEKGKMGALSELCAVDERIVAKAPDGASFAEAASVPLAGLTALQALTDVAGVTPGQKVLVHAGAGGVGSLAIQIAKALGATVATTTSTRNVELVRSLGADVVIDYTRQDFARELRDQDMVFETLGPDSELRSIAVLRPGGTMVGIAGLPDARFVKEQGVSAPIGVLLSLMTWKRRRAVAKAGVRYEYLFMRPDAAGLERLGGWIREKKVRPVLHQVFPFAEARAAFEELERGRARGKVVVSIR